MKSLSYLCIVMKHYTLEEMTDKHIGPRGTLQREQFEAEVEAAKSYRVKLVLRISPELHSRIAAASASAGTTINDFIIGALTHELARIGTA